MEECPNGCDVNSHLPWTYEYETRSGQRYHYRWEPETQVLHMTVQLAPRIEAITVNVSLADR
jgi:hypothetical protein